MLLCCYVACIVVAFLYVSVCMLLLFRTKHHTPLVICVVEPGLNILGLTHPKLSLPVLPAEVGRARGRRVCGECAGCLWARERYAMSALRLFHNIEG